MLTMTSLMALCAPSKGIPKCFRSCSSEFVGLSPYKRAMRRVSTMRLFLIVCLMPWRSAAATMMSISKLTPCPTIVWLPTTLRMSGITALMRGFPVTISWVIWWIAIDSAGISHSGSIRDSKESKGSFADNVNKTAATSMILSCCASRPVVSQSMQTKCSVRILDKVLSYTSLRALSIRPTSS